MSTRTKNPEKHKGRFTLFRRLWREESGQDLIEYGLLAMTIGVAGVLAWQSIVGGIGTAYGDWDTGTQQIWEPQDPAGP